MTTKKPRKTKATSVVEQTTSAPIVDTPVVINTEPKRTNVLILLDKSGSMAGDWSTTMAHLKEQIEMSKNQCVPGHEVYISVWMFNERVSQLSPFISAKEFAMGSIYAQRPDGGTALYDGMTQAISFLRSRMAMFTNPQDAALMITITDGEENSSWNKDPGPIKENIQGLEATGRYTFTFIGTEDAFSINQKFGINMGNTVVYKGAAFSGGTTTVGLSNYYASRTLGATQSAGFYGDQNLVQKAPDLLKTNFSFSIPPGTPDSSKTS